MTMRSEKEIRERIKELEIAIKETEEGRKPIPIISAINKIDTLKWVLNESD